MSGWSATPSLSSRLALYATIGSSSAKKTLLQLRPRNLEFCGQWAKDLFVFSCYTGLAYCDVMSLTKENISIGIDGEYWIMTSRKKTNQPVRVPLLSKALEIIEKYKHHPKAIATGTAFPNLTNQKLNSYLKEIADFCGITKNLTFHLARHTFATTVTLTNGVPIETVSKMLGHSNIRTTQVYAKVIEKKVSDDMMILRQKLG